MEPLGDFENNPNLTDKRFPSNPTRSYRSKDPLKVVAQLASWERYTDEEMEQMKSSLEKLRREGKAIIED